MKSIIVFCAVIVFDLAAHVKNTKSKGRKFELKCQGEVILLPEELETVFKTCHPKLFDWMSSKPTEEELKRKKQLMTEHFQNFGGVGCSFVCKAKALKLINNDGKIIKENFVKMVKKAITKKDLASKFIVEAEKCLNASPIILFKQDTCNKLMYEIDQVLRCVGEASNEICGRQYTTVTEGY